MCNYIKLGEIIMSVILEDPMPPLWIMFPWISRYSIGWRMGSGEDYRYKFWEWFDALSSQEQVIYTEMFPAPKMWRGIYDKDYSFEDGDDYACGSIELWNKNGEMQYNRNKTIDEYNGNKKIEFVFFWKPQNGIIDESCLSQWYLSKINVDTYCCAEQYMMAEKARLFEDNEILNAIMESQNPKDIKVLGKQVRRFEQTLWDKAKYSIVLNGNYYKFSQNKDMREYLLSTGSKTLVEASPLDTVWGIGCGRDDEKAHNPNTWRGSNLLGFALMEVRAEIRNVYKNYDKIDWEKNI